MRLDGDSGQLEVACGTRVRPAYRQLNSGTPLLAYTTCSSFLHRLAIQCHISDHKIAIHAAKERAFDLSYVRGGSFCPASTYRTNHVLFGLLLLRCFRHDERHIAINVSHFEHNRERGWNIPLIYLSRLVLVMFASEALQNRDKHRGAVCVALTAYRPMKTTRERTSTP